MKFTRSAKFALAAAASAALAVSLLTPAQAATRSTVILHETNPITGLNCSLSATNSTTCSAVGYLQGAGFNYYNNKKELVKNTVFGSYKIVKNSATDFRTQWTVNPGRVWSDGTPITGEDLLLSHVLSSDAYSIAAGLGDPKSKTNPPAFNGLGYSGVTVQAGSLYTMGAFDKKEMLLAYNSSSGEKLWEVHVGELLTNGWGDGPRMSPTISNGKIYALGARGNLLCVLAKNGELVWKKSLVDDLGGKVPGWGYTESVLVDQEKVICTPGGKDGTIAALDADSGRTIWRTKNFTDGAQYSSPISIMHQGKKQYVQLVMKNIVGIDPGNGTVLWKSTWPGKVAVIPTPIFSNGHVYVTSGYGVGCKLVKLGNNYPTNIAHPKHFHFLLLHLQHQII